MKKFLGIIVTLALVVAPLTLWAGDSLVIKGSTTVLPIAQRAVEVYCEMNPGVNVSVSGGGSGNGIKALIDGSTDIADTSRFIKDKEVNSAIENGIYPVPFRVAMDSIVPIVHPSNTAGNLSLVQLKDIYTGKVTNWEEVGGLNKPIVVVSRDTSSGTYECWHKIVLKKEKVTPSALLQASNGAVVQTVAKNKYAIGYIGLGYLSKDVKGLTVNGVMASKKTTLNGDYPIARPLFMFTNGWPKGITLDFINFVLSTEGQRIVEEEGYVPLI